VAVAKARFLQFQDHVAEIGALPAIAAGDARASFRYLPAAGFLQLAPTAAAAGFDRIKFFAGCTTRRAAYINGARIPSLLQQSFTFPATRLGSASDPPGSELLWMYVLYENAPALDSILPGTAMAGVLLFANGNMPYAANAHFHVARWNYSNFSLR